MIGVARVAVGVWCVAGGILVRCSMRMVDYAVISIDQSTWEKQERLQCINMISVDHFCDSKPLHNKTYGFATVYITMDNGQWTGLDAP